jgi:hypothetical protein
MLKRKNVWSVFHEFEDGASCEHFKVIGFFGSREKARAAVTNLKRMPGFKDHNKGFFVGKQRLDRGAWEGGFVTMQGDEAMPEPELPLVAKTVPDFDIQDSPDRLWYVLHSYVDQWKCINTFLIGLYTDLTLAKRAVEDRLDQLGFRSRPDGFQILPVTLGRIEYGGGF